jgi:hypothetical protein
MHLSFKTLAHRRADRDRACARAVAECDTSCGGIVTEVDDDDDEFFPIIFYPPALIHFLKLWLTYGDVYQSIDIHYPFEEDQRYKGTNKRTKKYILALISGEKDFVHTVSRADDEVIGDALFDTTSFHFRKDHKDVDFRCVLRTLGLTTISQKVYVRRIHPDGYEDSGDDVSLFLCIFVYVFWVF